MQDAIPQMGEWTSTRPGRGWDGMRGDFLHLRLQGVWDGVCASDGR